MTTKGGAGRPERPIDKDSPFAEFALGLRQLRKDAHLDIRDLARLTGYSLSSISAAANGRSLPSLALTQAFAQSCGGDPELWAKQWRRLVPTQQSFRDKIGMSSGKRRPNEVPSAKGTAASADRPTPSTEPVQPFQSGQQGIDAHLSLWEETGEIQTEASQPDDYIDSGRPQQGLSPIPASYMDAAGYVVTTSGQHVQLAEGTRLVFGRGPGADLAIAAGRGLSRRAGVVIMMAAGAWIANISHTHALYVQGEGYRIRLPRMEADGEPADGWFMHAGTAEVGSRSMLDDRQPITVVVAASNRSEASAWNSAGVVAEEKGRWTPTGREPAIDTRDESESAAEGTLLPFNIDPMTKLFLVALLWCRPWLIDPSATAPLPRTPEIARGALEVTGAYRELERFDTDLEFRDVLSARVAEHVKVLRRKIVDHGLSGADVRLSDEIAVRILIEHGIITSDDLGRLDDTTWRSRQEDLWWTRE